MKNNNEKAIDSVNNKRSSKGIIITIIVVGIVIVGSILTLGILYFQPKSELDKCLESAYALPETAEETTNQSLYEKYKQNKDDKAVQKETVYPRKEAIDKCYQEN